MKLKKKETGKKGETVEMMPGQLVILSEAGRYFLDCRPILPDEFVLCAAMRFFSFGSHGKIV